MSKYNGNYNSTINQKIKEQLVNREVLSCETDIVEYILSRSNEDGEAPFTWDDVENIYKKVCSSCGDNLEEIDENDIIPIHKYQCVCCSENYDTYEEAKACCEDDETEGGEVKEVWLCPFCEDEYETEQEAKECVCHYREAIYKCIGCGEYFLEYEVREENQEVYEWWQVTGYFADELRDLGEVVISGFYNYWGRCCTGQAISLDWVIDKIAEDMEILDGQKHSWGENEE